MFKPEIKKIYIGFPYCKFKSVGDAYDWIVKQDDYKNKNAIYEICCHSSIEID